MANNRFKIPVILIYILLSSCSLVKENRDSCPCNLTVEVTGVKDVPANILVTSLQDSSQVQLLSVSQDTLITLYVPRGGVTLSAWAGTSTPLRIPAGSQSPPLYLYHAKVDTRGDIAYAPVQLHKQFCTLTLEVEGPPGWGTPIGSAVRGAACGMSITGGIMPGEFNYCPPEPEVQAGETVLIGTVRIPRQSPDSPLMLDIIMEDNIVRTFSLGAYLQKSGYNWTAMDLEDITVHMYLSVSAITITVPELSKPISLTVDI